MYDEKLKRWVNKDGDDDIAPAAPASNGFFLLRQDLWVNLTAVVLEMLGPKSLI